MTEIEGSRITAKEIEEGEGVEVLKGYSACDVSKQLSFLVGTYSLVRTRWAGNVSIQPLISCISPPFVLRSLRPLRKMGI